MFMFDTFAYDLFMSRPALPLTVIGTGRPSYTPVTPTRKLMGFFVTSEMPDTSTFRSLSCITFLPSGVNVFMVSFPSTIENFDTSSETASFFFVSFLGAEGFFAPTRSL